MMRLGAVAHEHYGEVDVTDWPVVGDEPLGTKPKQWLTDPRTGDRWLTKNCTFNPRSDGTVYRKGDDWSERVANGIAGRLGLPAARTELAFNDLQGERRYGVISKSVVAASERGSVEEALVLGNQLLPHPTVGRDRTGYSISAVREALDGVSTPVGVESYLTAWDVFVGYLVLDAVVGNTDRHPENWAVIDRVGGRSLAPTFDHASCLGFLLDDGERRARLGTRDRNFTPEAYADRARSPFQGAPHPVDVAVEALTKSDSRARQLWLSRCERVDDLVEPIRMIPVGRMSAPAREFAERVLRRNCYRLLSSGN